MVLGRGELDGRRVLSGATVDLMARDHIGDLSAVGWRSMDPGMTEDVDLLPGQRAAWGLSFMINTEATAEGRAPGSLAWGGLANTYFWIDPWRRVSGVFATQVLPFFDPRIINAFSDFERAVYLQLG
jgi:methyl acetate hydrolase